MNQDDKDNLNFLLSATPEVLKDWFESVSDDDHLYASELLAAYKLELAEIQSQKELEDGFEEQIAAMDCFPLVQSLLSKMIH
jgi:hypothetical protein